MSSDELSEHSSSSPSGNNSDQESDISQEDISVSDDSQEDISVVDISSDDDAPLRRPRPIPRVQPSPSPAEEAPRPSTRSRPALPKARRDKSPRRPSAAKPSGSKPTGPRSMSKQWCYTINHPRKSVVQGLRSVRHSTKPAVEYHVFQLETGASGTLHVQGFICLAKRAQLSTVKTLLGGNPHLEVTRGTPAQAAAYCKDPSKRDPRHADFCYEWGTLPQESNGQGQRNDLATFKAALDAGTPMAVLVNEQFSTWVRHYKAFDKYRTEFVHKPRSTKSLVFVFDGETGCGKSAAAFAFSNAFPVPPGSSNTTWFDGYDPDVNPTVIFDDMHGGRVSWTELLRLTDKYPMTVNSKGAHIQFRPRAIVFTSNTEPVAWYKPEVIPDKGPFLRRVDYHWRYYRADTKALAQAIVDAAVHTAVALKFTLHGICECIKGEPTVHPHFGRYIPFDAMGAVYYAIVTIEEPFRAAYAGLW